LNEFESDYVNENQLESIKGSHDLAIEDSHDSTIEDSYDSTIEVQQDLQDSIEMPYLQDSNINGQSLQDSTQKGDLNSKVFKPFKIPTNDPEKIKLYKHRPRMPLREATNNIILQLPETDKPLNITMNLSINN
ncbi:5423_t:CDS:2, partial [Dentiscutata erythropus]